MAGTRLSEEQLAELREAALTLRAIGRRGSGGRGRQGANVVEQLVALAAERFGAEISARRVQQLLGELGLVHVRLAQGGYWRAAR